MIEMHGIKKTYTMGEQTINAVDDVSLDVKAGEFIAIVGPSGSGKTTLMNLIACLDTPTSGVYRLDSVEVGSLDDDSLSRVRNSKIGLVFQSYNLLPRMTAIENVEMPLTYGEAPIDGQSAKRALEDVGLGDRIHHWPSQLSGGQQQRVAIARALINNPAVVIADEPTGALDIRSGLEVMEIFQRLNREGRTIILVTHEQSIAEHAARVITLREGKVDSDRPNDRPLDARAELEKIPQEVQS